MTPSSITVGTPVATLSVPDAVPPPLFGLPRVDDGVMASLLPKQKPKGETNSDTDRNAPITASIDRAVGGFGKRRSDRLPTGRCHAVLDGLAAKNLEKFDWRHSIVDLMKLVGMAVVSTRASNSPRNCITAAIKTIAFPRTSGCTRRL